jgi:tetratricopeptide (TPR) repeat protein
MRRQKVKWFFGICAILGTFSLIMPNAQSESVKKPKAPPTGGGVVVGSSTGSSVGVPTGSSAGVQIGLLPLGQKRGKVLRPYEDSAETKVDIKKTKELLEAIDMILKNDKQIESKVDLYIKKAYLLYSLGKKMKLQVDQNGNSKPASYMPYFDQSMVIADQLVNIDKKKPLLSKQQHALIHFVRGSIGFELGKDSEMLQEFLASLSYDSTTRQSASMSLIIAEYYFDHDKFDDAIQSYQKLYAQYDSQQKGIADYKTAWCYLIQKNPQKAEAFFIQGINIRPEHSLVDDSIRDLAFVSTQLRNEEQNLAFAMQVFGKNLNYRAAFLLALIRQMFAIDKKRIPYKLFNEAFKTNRSLNEKVQILGILISYERREYPTKGQIIAFNHLYSLAAKTKPEKIGEMLAAAKQLSEDLEFYIKIFVDGYMQKIQAVKISDRSQFTEALNKMIPFHLDHFGVEKNVILYYSLWIDIARKEENLALLDSIRRHWEVKKIKFSDGQLDLKIDNRVRVEIIGLLESKSISDPSLKPRLLTELLAFAEKYPSDVNILPISRRISEIYLGDGKFKEAIPYLKAIYLREPKIDSFYNLKLAAFQLGDYESVTNDPETVKYATEPRILDLLRESSLKQAAKHLEKNDFGKYEESIHYYLKSKPDEKKAILVYSDYFSKLIERKQNEKVCAEYGGLDKKAKGEKEILKYLESSLDLMFSEGAFFDCPSYSLLVGPAAANYKIILYLRCLNKAFDDSEMTHMKSLDMEKQRTVLSLMALGQPKEAVAYYKKNLPTQAEDQRIYFVALKMSQKKDLPILVGPEIAMFKDQSEAKIQQPIDSKIDKQISQFFFPTKKTKSDRYSKVMEDVFYRIKVLRRTFVKESASMAENQRLTTLVKLAETERKVSQVILDSPRPEGMTPEELDSYNQELAKAAAEYTNQADEYTKVKTEIEKRLGDVQAQIEARKVPAIDIDKWAWPPGPLTEKVRTIVKERGIMPALVFLEYQRNGGKIHDKEYYILQGWCPYVQRRLRSDAKLCPGRASSRWSWPGGR